MINSQRFQPHHLWLVIFSLWFIFLSGVLTPFLGSPGMIQSLRLRQALDSKQKQFARAEDELLKLQEDSALLEKSHIVQQREIRSVLNYATPDELIFDFNTEISSL